MNPFDLKDFSVDLIIFSGIIIIGSLLILLYLWKFIKGKILPRN
jgi:hypothetical protein